MTASDSCIWLLVLAGLPGNELIRTRSLTFPLVRGVSPQHPSEGPPSSQGTRQLVLSISCKHVVLKLTLLTSPITFTPIKRENGVGWGRVPLPKPRLMVQPAGQPSTLLHRTPGEQGVCTCHPCPMNSTLTCIHLESVESKFSKIPA